MNTTGVPAGSAVVDAGTKLLCGMVSGCAALCYGPAMTVPPLPLLNDHALAFAMASFNPFSSRTPGKIAEPMTKDGVPAKLKASAWL